MLFKIDNLTAYDLERNTLIFSENLDRRMRYSPVNFNDHNLAKAESVRFECTRDGSHTITKHLSKCTSIQSVSYYDKTGTMTEALITNLLKYLPNPEILTTVKLNDVNISSHALDLLKMSKENIAKTPQSEQKQHTLPTCKRMPLQKRESRYFDSSTMLAEETVVSLRVKNIAKILQPVATPLQFKHNVDRKDDQWEFSFDELFENNDGSKMSF